MRARPARGSGSRRIGLIGAALTVLLALLTKFAWRPLLQALETRQQAIRKSLEDADRARQELERLQQESAQTIRQARLDGEAIIAQSRADADRLRSELAQKAREEANTIIRRAEHQIQLETRQALQQIRHQAVDLSVMIASKLLERHVSKEDDQRLIEETLKQIENSNH